MNNKIKYKYLQINLGKYRFIIANKKLDEDKFWGIMRCGVFSLSKLGYLDISTF